jgi:hypothetical protein
MMSTACASHVTVKEVILDKYTLPKKQYLVVCGKNASIDSCLFALDRICGIRNFSIFPLSAEKAFYNIVGTHDVSYVGSCVNSK